MQTCALKPIYRTTSRLLAAAAATVLLSAAPVAAQYKPQPMTEAASGEQWHIEGSTELWLPSANMVVASESLGIEGTRIDLKRDLGATDHTIPQLTLQLRPARNHKFRFMYTPIKYEASSTLQQDIVFNGIRYRFGLPVNTVFDWKAYRFGYEYDFFRRNSGFAGLLVEAKYTDVQVQLNSPIAAEFARARGPIPAIGGVGRYYVVPNVSITGELTAFKIPDSIDSRYNAHYVDLDIYGTVNFTNNIGVKGGYRSTDVGYLIKADTGSFVLKGIYFGAVFRY